jgi:hypothetical protein
MPIDEHRFDAELEEASILLSDHPREGTPGHDRLMILLAEIASYRPKLRESPDEQTSERARLAKRLDAFEDRVIPHYGPHWASMIGGDIRAR